MIFKQVREIVAGTKTETRRIAKPNELMTFDGGCAIKTYKSYEDRMDKESRGRVKWRVGQDYAVIPKRGYHGVYYDIETGTIYGHGYEPLGEAHKPANIIVPLRYKILSIHREPLQAITRDGAWAEGITGYSSRPITGYRKLWKQINGDGSWERNPHVWVIRFEVLKVDESVL